MLELKVTEDPIIKLEMAKADSANLKTESGGGTNNYNQLKNKPEINGHVLEGNKTLAELGLTVDTTLNGASNNPVANSAVVGGLEAKQNTLTFDTTPTEDSTNPVTSGGVYNGLSAKQNTLAFDTTPTTGSTNPVTSSGIAEAIADALEATEPHIDVVLWPLGANGILVNFRGFADYTTFAALAASPEFAVAIQKTVNVYAGTLQNYVGQATIYTGLNGGVSAIWTIWMADAILMNGEYADGFSGMITYDSQHHEWYLANPTTHQPLYFELLETKADIADVPTKTSDLINDSGFVNATEAANAAPVQSVNGQTGAVTLTASDVGAMPDSVTIPTKTSDLQNDGASGTSTYVQTNELATVATSGSYNDLSNKPTIPAAQVNSDWNANSGVAQILNKPSIPTKTSDLTNDSGYVNATQAANAAPVQSVNGQTGTVSLGASDVGALPNTTAIPTKTSDLTNDSDYTTAAATDAKLALKAASAGASANYAAKLTASIPFGSLDSTSTATAMTATVPGITELKDGVTMILYNGVVTSASGFTLNINGLGAKPSYSNMALGNPVTPTSPTRDTTIFNINYAFIFVYSETLVSGGCWIGYRGYDANTNTIGYQLRTNNTTMKTTDKFYRYRLLFTSADGTKWVPANTSTSTNATAARTPNTRAIDPFGEIVWYGTTTAIEANANVTAAQIWQEYYGSYTNIGYSFNNTGAAQTMTANLPIYIKCTPQADGSAIIDPTTPYTQTLPTTDDGKIYIYLGRAYNATNFEITMNHPVYYHDGSGIRLWTGQRIPAGLPSVSAADNGKVLQVVNGAWAAATIPSANGVNF